MSHFQSHRKYPRHSLEQLLKKLRWGDVLLLLGMFVLSFYVWHWSKKSEGKRLMVEITQGEQKSLFPLNEKRDLILTNNTGKKIMLIKLQSGGVWVEEADCPRQYCVQRGVIGSVGQWIACLPNKVFIRIFATKQKTETQNPFFLDATVS